MVDLLPQVFVLCVCVCAFSLNCLNLLLATFFLLITTIKKGLGQEFWVYVIKLVLVIM